jgi:glycosyltransferase involved in cell wall biosynthesis
MKIQAFYPNFFKDYGISHACYYLMKSMQSNKCKVSLVGIASDSIFNDQFYTNIIHKYLHRVAYNFFSEKQIHRLSEFIFVYTLRDADVVYLWPGVTLKTYKKIKKLGYKIAYEAVNSHEVTSKHILDQEYSKLNIAISHEINATKVAEESEKLELANYIFSCSPIMTESMLQNGIQPSKILQTTYGLSRDLILDKNYPTPNSLSYKPTFIFVGSMGVRKGIHLLLDYWTKANLNANLKLVGNIEDAVKDIVMPYLNNPSIEHIPFTSDLPSIYKCADVFVLPSLEEGSPLVTYMAFGAGLPLIVSPMAGGGVVTDGKEGAVINPHDAEKWIETLREFAENYALRKTYSDQSKAQAQQYTWEAVGKKRMEKLMAAINK